jgi:hypothetical protein
MGLKLLGNDNEKFSRIIGMKTTNKIDSHHLFEIKKGRFVKMPRSPVVKEKIAIIPSRTGNIIEIIRS